MSMPSHTNARPSLREELVEDDLSAMTGLFNGLAISFGFYAVAFATWWMW